MGTGNERGGDPTVHGMHLGGGGSKGLGLACGRGRHRVAEGLDGRGGRCLAEDL